MNCPCDACDKSVVKNHILIPCGQGCPAYYEYPPVKTAIAVNNNWWIEKISPIINKLILLVEHGDYSNGNTDTTGQIDEGIVSAMSLLNEICTEWQQLKKEATDGSR